MIFRISVRGEEQVNAFLQALPRGTMRAALRAIAEYIVGDERHGLRHDDPYKYVSRAKAYGKVAEDGAPAGYFSWKQFRYVMAKIAEDEIQPGQRKYSPTQASQAYGITETRNGYGQTITNPQPGAFWTRSDDKQPRQLEKVGWRKFQKLFDDNWKGAMRSGLAKANEWLRSRSKK